MSKYIGGGIDIVSFQYADGDFFGLGDNGKIYKWDYQASRWLKYWSQDAETHE